MIILSNLPPEIQTEEGGVHIFSEPHLGVILEFAYRGLKHTFEFKGPRYDEAIGQGQVGKRKDRIPNRCSYAEMVTCMAN